MFESIDCRHCLCFPPPYSFPFAVGHFFKPDYLKISRGLIIAMYDGLFSAFLFLYFSVGFGFLDHLCLLETHLLGLSDTTYFFVPFLTSLGIALHS